MALDIDVCTETSDVTEREADKQAMRWALPTPLNLQPPISKRAVIDSAADLGVHPGLIVGRLQYRKVRLWTHLSDLTPNVRDQLITWSRDQPS